MRHEISEQSTQGEQSPQGEQSDQGDQSGQSGQSGQRDQSDQSRPGDQRDQRVPLDLLGIVDLVGGADNVLRLTRCWSRLRLVLVEDQDAQLGAIERLDSVVDVAHRSGELQVTLSSGLGEAFELLSQRLPAATRS